MPVLDTYTIAVLKPDGSAFEVELEGQGVTFTDKLQAETFAKNLAAKEDIAKVFVMKRSVFRIYLGKDHGGDPEKF